MDIISVENIIDEIAGNAVPIADRLEGLTDYLNLSLSGQTKDMLVGHRKSFEHRMSLSTDALTKGQAFVAALQSLLGDGYPAIPQAEFSQAAFSEIQAATNKELAALSTIHSSQPANTVTAVVSDERPTP